MPPTRQVSHRQLELIVEFAEANRSIVVGSLGKGPLDQREANKAWEKLARKLNCVGGGVCKTPVNWKRYWHLLKCRTKGKAADLRRSVVGAGGPNKIIPLSDLEERIVAVVGKLSVPEFSIPSNVTMETVLQERVDVKTEGQEVKVELQDYFSETSASLTSSAAESATSPALEPCDPLVATSGDLRETPAAASNVQDSQRTSRPRRNSNENLPRWAYDLEERRIAVEGRIADEIADLGATNKAILGCLQQLVTLLEGHLNNSNHPT